MDKFDIRVADQTGIWSDWAPANNDEAIGSTIFAKNVHVRKIRYEYKDGTMIEYRRREI